jgi:hypothetical protein
MIEKITLTFILIFTIGYLYAQNNENQPANVAPSWTVPDLVTDRPDQTESSVTVPHKSLQIETGFVFERFIHDDYTFDNYGIASTLFRYGLLKNMELRLASNYQYSELKTTGSTIDTIQQGMGHYWQVLKYTSPKHMAPGPSWPYWLI